MRIPIELVNIILDYADLGKFLCYKHDRKEYAFRFDVKHKHFSELNRLYGSLALQTEISEDGYRTNIYYNIPLQRPPSVTMMMENVDSIKNYMSIIVFETENDIVTEHHTSIVICTTNSALILN